MQKKIPTTPPATLADSAYEYAEGAHHVVHLLEVAPDDQERDPVADEEGPRKKNGEGKQTFVRKKNPFLIPRLCEHDPERRVPDEGDGEQGEVEEGGGGVEAEGAKQAGGLKAGKRKEMCRKMKNAMKLF